MREGMREATREATREVAQRSGDQETFAWLEDLALHSTVSWLEASKHLKPD